MKTISEGGGDGMKYVQPVRGSPPAESLTTSYGTYWLELFRR